MKSEEKSLMGIVLALSAEFDFKAKITPESLYDLMRRVRAVLPPDAPDVFAAYDSAEKVRQIMDRLVGLHIMKNENGEYPLGGIGIMRASGVCFNSAYMRAAYNITQEWFSQWERK
ncbi:MAG: hypothetical protein WC852_05825 [Candidatus Nanoarchaeia archaeon]|jgi:hypothetical protein